MTSWCVLLAPLSVASARASITAPVAHAATMAALSATKSNVFRPDTQWLKTRYISPARPSRLAATASPRRPAGALGEPHHLTSSAHVRPQVRRACQRRAVEHAPHHARPGEVLQRLVD